MPDQPQSSVVAEANAAIEENRLEEARALLADRVELERDIEALRLLGEVHHGLGDLPAAGAAWFGAGVRGPEVDAAVEAWRAEHDDDFLAMWRSLPRSVREAPRSKKVDALRTKAQEVKRGAAAETESSRTQPQPEKAPASARAASSGARSAVTARPAASAGPDDEDAADGERGSSTSTAVTKVASKAVSKVSSGGGGGRLDAAQIIAWVIAAFVVLCAVVGLVTILRWLVPG